MRLWSHLLAGVVGLTLIATGTHAADCPEGRGGLGVSRVVEIDTTGGPVFGSITKRQKEKSFLAAKEVVLTFDDGPMPGVTRSILDTLDRFCTKATFFSVGKMAIAYPETVRDILKRGHTLGTHTWSHPMNLPRLKGTQAIDQIESGFAAAALAAGQPIAPFFRFPGLNDSEALVRHLERRGIATFTVDVVSNDSYITDPARLIERTLSQLQAENGGIALFHDIKPQTARALPTLLAEIKARGYRIVHLRAKAPFQSDEAYTLAMREHVAAKRPVAMRSLLAVTDVPAAPAPAMLPPEPTGGDAKGPTEQVAEGPEPRAAIPAKDDAQPTLKPVRSRRQSADSAVAAQTEVASPAQNGVAPASRAAQPEVLAGSYGSGARIAARTRPLPGAEKPAVVPTQGAEVLAGSYTAQPASIAPTRVRVAPVEKSWSDSLSDRMREIGN